VQAAIDYMQSSKMNSGSEISATAISSVMDMGFSEEMAREALTVCNGSVEGAIDYLLK